MGKAQTENGKLSFWVKFGYGALEGSGTSIWILVYLFLMYFLTDVVKINPVVAGSVLMIATLWDALSGFIIGIISDRSKSKWGRRRPFLLAASVPFGITTWLLFTDFQLGSTLNTVYFICMVILFFTFFTMQNVPYSALGAEMTQDYNERMSLVSYRMEWGQVLGIVAAALPLLMAEMFTEMFGSPREGWSAMGAVFGFCSIFPILFTWRMTRGYERHPEKTEIGLKDIRFVLINNRTFRYTIGVWAFSIIGLTFFTSTSIYFFTYVMGFNEEQSSTAFAALFIVGVFYIPIINIVSKKFGKNWGFIFFGSFCVLMSALVGIWITAETSILFWVILVTSLSVTSVLPYMIGWAMITDVSEVDELLTGQRREGLYFGIMAFIQKLATALVLQVIGVTLAWVGYVPEVAQTTKTLWAIKILMYEASALFFFLAIVVAFLMPMTKKKHKTLIEILKLKKGNKEYDPSEIRDLVSSDSVI